MTMKWLTILQFLEIVAAYGIVTLFLPWLVLRKRFRRFSAAEQLTGYFFAGNFYIIYLVYLLQFLHISNRVTLTAGTVAECAAGACCDGGRDCGNYVCLWAEYDRSLRL